jgi:homoserine O-acetyltransferase
MTKLLRIVTLLLLAPTGAYCHTPEQPPHQMAVLGDLELEEGGAIPNLRMSYVTHGKLNSTKSNAILFLHDLGGNHHSGDHLIGPGKALDSDKYFIICVDELGNSQTTFEHSTSPTNSGLKMRFPYYKGRDQVNAGYRLVTQALRIPRLLAVTGVSSGADQAVQMAVSHPDFMEAIIPISGGALWTTDGLGFTGLALSVLESCSGWLGGNYEANPVKCAADAMMIFVPYFYTREWWEQHIDTAGAYTKWRNTWGAHHFDLQDARDVYYRQIANSRGWVGDTPGFNGWPAALRSIKARALFLASPYDHFVPRQVYEIQVKMIPQGRISWIDSTAGHLVCCDADPSATRAMSEAITAFLKELIAQKKDNN